MAKKSTVKVRLVHEEKADSKNNNDAKKQTNDVKAKDKLRIKKYNHTTKKNKWIVKKKQRPHRK